MRSAGCRPVFHAVDVKETSKLAAIASESECEAVIHFAGLKHVAESMERPFDYLDVNLAGLTSVLKASEAAGIRRLIFSSSGSVYGNAAVVPIPEDAPLQPTNPYSKSKALCEEILAAICAVDPRWSVVALRYFNPAGAHPSGLIGEDPTHLITNIVPVLMEAAAGELDAVTINGTDFDTPDGTAIRDYVHVLDVVDAHCAALDIVVESTGFEALNIGRGEGVSVAQLIAAAESAIGIEIPVKEGPRRAGDVPALAGDTTLASDRLGLTELQSVEAIFRDAWRFPAGSD